MATAKKLPSGSWRCRVYSHTDASGKKIYKSFTCNDPSPRGKRKCEAEAAAWASDKDLHKADLRSMTFGQALDSYIEGRTATLSPNTIKDYTVTRKRHIQSLMDLPIDRITSEQIQRALNEEALSMSPKTVANYNALIMAVLNVYRPDFRPVVTLPQRERVDYNIPVDEDVRRLIEDVRGGEMELPILLAAFGPMRRGEICALHSRNISGNIVHVCENMVAQGDDWIIRHPKSYAGDRFIDYPDFVAKLWEGKTGRICDLTPTALSRRFERIRDRLGFKFRFHDLRHYSASIQHALGIPDAYIMQRGGWASDGVLKQVYRHALEDNTRRMNSIANDHFSAIYDTKYDTNQKEPRKNGVLDKPEAGLEPQREEAEECRKSKIVEYTRFKHA